MNLPAARLERGTTLALPPLVRATDGTAPRLATHTWLRDDGDCLRVAFECEDPEPWATVTERDGALWEEEVVEVFLAPGHATPRRYFEVEVNPLGTVFDARVESPRGDRRGWRVDPSWDCPGLVAKAEVDAERGLWRAELALPWRAFAPDPETADWRLNVFRIDRPRDATAEYSAWSPTGVVPADFHRPAAFAYVTRARIE